MGRAEDKDRTSEREREDREWHLFTVLYYLSWHGVLGYLSLGLGPPLAPQCYLPDYVTALFVIVNLLCQERIESVGKGDFLPFLRSFRVLLIISGLEKPGSACIIDKFHQLLF